MNLLSQVIFDNDKIKKCGSSTYVLVLLHAGRADLTDRVERWKVPNRSWEFLYFTFYGLWVPYRIADAGSYAASADSCWRTCDTSPGQRTIHDGRNAARWQTNRFARTCWTASARSTICPTRLPGRSLREHITTSNDRAILIVVSK